MFVAPATTETYLRLQSRPRPRFDWPSQAIESGIFFAHAQGEIGSEMQTQLIIATVVIVWFFVCPMLVQYLVTTAPLDEDYPDDIYFDAERQPTEKRDEHNQ